MIIQSIVIVSLLSPLNSHLSLSLVALAVARESVSS